jgi:2-methylisocitrate lyase-like PEP mutase family enzyme
MPDLAGRLRALHLPGDPIVLANVWDAGSARLVEAAGFPAIATSSGAVARAMGSEDHEVMSVDEAFGAVARVAAAVSVPVTADIESGYGLAPAEVVDRLLATGAVGCNLEDTDHASGGIVDAGTQAARIAAVRAAAGDRIVINARVDSFLLKRPDALGEAVERGRAYLDAGADVVYPITASDEGDIAALVAALGVINVNLSPASPSLARLAALGVARVSTAAGLHRIMTKQVGAVLAALRDGDDSPFRRT